MEQKIKVCGSKSVAVGFVSKGGAGSGGSKGATVGGSKGFQKHQLNQVKNLQQQKKKKKHLQQKQKQLYYDVNVTNNIK